MASITQQIFSMQFESKSNFSLWNENWNLFLKIHHNKIVRKEISAKLLQKTKKNRNLFKYFLVFEWCIISTRILENHIMNYFITILQKSAHG